MGLHIPHSKGSNNMAKVFISALGTGDYRSGAYTFDGQPQDATPYIQRAILGAKGPTFFDRVVILLTPKARAKHWEKAFWLPDRGEPIARPTLRVELEGIVPSDRLFEQSISENVAEPAEQWSWFQAILDHVGKDDDLYIDMTHGFRVVPIVLSAALNYLQAIKGVRLRAAYYAADDAPDRPVVDFKDFYTLGQWADAVNRLVENADAGKLATLATSDSNLHFPEMNRPEMVAALQTLTGVLKNIDVNAVAAAAHSALQTLRDALDRLDPKAGAQRQMIVMVLEKFATLSTDGPISGRYDLPYFKVQSEIARLLLEHGFLMQAFTVLRELIGSVGMLGLEGTKYAERQMEERDGRSARRRYAEVFVNMVQHDLWDFKGDAAGQAETLRPFFERLMAVDRDLGGSGDNLRSSVQRLVRIRNGFDHAWTSTAEKDRPSANKLDEFKTLGESVRVRLVAVVGRLFEVVAAVQSLES